MIQETRVRVLQDEPVRKGRYVLYWMQQSQRADWNHALEYAIERGNELGLPVVVGFGLMPGYPEANLRHYTFLLEGLRETERRLGERGVRLVVRLGAPDEVALGLAVDAAMVIVDRGYLRHQRAWRERVAREAGCPVVQVESDVVVPVEAASNRDEYAARTLRPKIHRLLPEYLVSLQPRKVKRDSLGLALEGVKLSGIETRLKVDRSVGPAEGGRGGATEAERLLGDFLDRKLVRYAEGRNEPGSDIPSGLSPYLHFGQISALRVALAAGERAQGCEPSVEAFLEELIVRRELAMNFTHFNPAYDRYECVPAWARASLAKHEGDPREPAYDLKTLESAKTLDPYWNAAMNEMLRTGRMHGYMRMYWGKKLIEWLPDPETAFDTALMLNNKYFLDGRDPNSYAGVAWLFGKHDRPWGERPVFGVIRYMNAKGLERKFDMKGYVERFV
ncbi:MAG: deoxyribodipyrimidine photo-lyase [FCB group bacterium]|jgi:deoxyribodipyrimidine photo-lyase|nr:deoxyribodipyrimidine photo-lyase [FCB group bacterium]